MKTKEAIDLFGGKPKGTRKLAEALKISVQAVQAWGEDVPPLRVYQIKEIVGNKTIKDIVQDNNLKFPV